MISIKQYCNERLFKLSRIKLLPNEIHLWSINWKELEDYIAYSARTAHPFQRNGAPFRFKLSKAQQVD